MLKRLGMVVVAFCLAWSVPANAQNSKLRPLSQAMQQEDSPSMEIYIYKRCAALWAAMGYRMKASGRDDVKELVQQSVAGISVFLNAALNKATENGLNEDRQSIQSDTQSLISLYSDRMQQHYLQTGNAFGPLVKGDVALCKTLRR